MGSVKEAFIIVPSYTREMQKKSNSPSNQEYLKDWKFMTNFMIQNVGIHNIIDILHFIELNFINSSFTLQTINVRS